MNAELPNNDAGGGPAGVYERAEEGGGPAGVVEGLEAAKENLSPPLRLRRSGVEGRGLEEAGT